MNIYHGERIVEIPWFEKQLQTYKGSILDIGSAGTDLTEIRRQKRYIVRVDRLFKTESSDEHEIVISRNILKLTVKDLGLFDIVSLISTLEHIGLDAYGFKDRKGNPWKVQAETLIHCSKFVTETGIVLLTLPYGKEEDGGWYLVYDKKKLNNLKESFKVEREDYFSLDFDTWTYNHVCENKCHNLGQDWVRPDFSRASNVVCLILRRKDV